jgi:hypothetical protein
MQIGAGVLTAIGNTPLVELVRVVPTVATTIVDSGLRYVSRDVFRS